MKRCNSISASVSFQSIVEFLNLEVTDCNIIAAETEIFKLSVKPTIGIFIKPSACFITFSLTPSRSEPKNNALFLIFMLFYSVEIFQVEIAFNFFLKKNVILYICIF